MLKKMLVAALLALLAVLFVSGALADGPVNPRMRHVRDVSNLPMVRKRGPSGISLSGPDTMDLSAPAEMTASITDGDISDYIIEYGVTDEGRKTGYVYLLHGVSSLTHTVDKLLFPGEYCVWALLYDRAEYEAYAAGNYEGAKPQMIDYHWHYLDVTGSGDTLEDAVSSAANECGRATAWETALAIHDYLTSHIYYDMNYEYYGTDAFIRGYGVCDSYSKAFCALCGACGIDCQRVRSIAQCHAWNVVYLEDVWSLVDVTWDDPSGVDSPVSGSERYDYFGLNQELMALDHAKNDWEIEAADGSAYAFDKECTSLAANYFMHEDQWQQLGMFYVSYPEPALVSRMTAVQAKLEDGVTSFSLSWSTYATAASSSSNYLSSANRYRAYTYHALGISAASFCLSTGETVRVDAVFDKGNMKLDVSFAAWDVEEDGRLTLPASTAAIEEEAFMGVSATHVELPEGCETIGARAFAESGVRVLSIPSTVTSIADDAFEGCGRLLFLTGGNDVISAFARSHGVFIVPQSPSEN